MTLFKNVAKIEKAVFDEARQVFIAECMTPLFKTVIKHQKGKAMGDANWKRRVNGKPVTWTMPYIGNGLVQSRTGTTYAKLSTGWRRVSKKGSIK